MHHRALSSLLETTRDLGRVDLGEVLRDKKDLKAKLGTRLRAQQMEWSVSGHPNEVCNPPANRGGATAPESPAQEVINGETRRVNIGNKCLPSSKSASVEDIADTNEHKVRRDNIFQEGALKFWSSGGSIEFSPVSCLRNSKASACKPSTSRSFRCTDKAVAMAYVEGQVSPQGSEPVHHS